MYDFKYYTVRTKALPIQSLPDSSKVYFKVQPVSPKPNDTYIDSQAVEKAFHQGSDLSVLVKDWSKPF